METKLKLGGSKESAWEVKVHELNPQPGNILELQFDLDIFTLDEAVQVAGMWTKVFPHNKIVVTFRGVEFKGIMDEDFKCSKTFSHDM